MTADLLTTGRWQAGEALQEDHRYHHSQSSGKRTQLMSASHRSVVAQNEALCACQVVRITDVTRGRARSRVTDVSGRQQSRCASVQLL